MMLIRKNSRHARSLMLAALPLYFVAAPSLSGCSSDAPQAPKAASSPSPLTWTAPVDGVSIRVSDTVELAVLASHPDSKAVAFTIDGAPLATCDPTADAEEDCRRGDLFRWTTTFTQTGAHTIVATFVTTAGETITSEKRIEVLAADPAEALADPENESLAGAAVEEPPTPEELALLEAEQNAPPPLANPDFSVDAKNIGFRDPNRGYHSVFGGVRWAVSGDRVLVRQPPKGSVSLVSSCLRRYGTSIRRWADHYKLSRATVVATAITESSCTNPRGSSDGLSSGPMQVTASTCSALTGLSNGTCRVRMHTQPDFSFAVGSKYMGSSYQRRQHHQDPPKIGAAYNAGSIRRSSANRWHLLVTGNHLERWVGAYNAYRSWESSVHLASPIVEADPVFEGSSVASKADLPATAAEGQVVFVGTFAGRDGDFAEFRGGRWLMNDERE